MLQHICEISDVKGVAIVHEPGGLTPHQGPASASPASSLAPEACTRQAMLLLCLRCSASSPHLCHHSRNPFHFKASLSAGWAEP